MASELSKQVGATLKKLLKTTGNTQESAVALLKTVNNAPALSQYLNGVRTISIDILVDFCDSFKITPNELLGFEPAVANNTDIQLVINIVDTLNFFLKKEKAEMSEENRTKLIKYLYEKNTPKEQIVPTIEIWMEANPNMFKKIA